MLLYTSNILLYLIILTKFLIICVYEEVKVSNISLTTQYELRNRMIFISYYIGSPSQKVYSKLSLEGQDPVVSRFHYRSKYSESGNDLGLKELTIKEEKNWKYRANQHIDYVGFFENYMLIDNFTFCVVDVELGSYVPFLPFSYKFDDYSHSIIHKYKSKGIINKLTFYFKPNNKDHKGEIHIGENKNIENAKFFGFCNTEKNETNWGCFYTGLKIEKTEIIAPSFVVFSTTENRLIVPEKVFDAIVNEVFPSYFEDGICSYTRYPLLPLRKYVDCRCNQINETFPNITIIINNYNFVFTYKELFRSFFNACTFIFELDTKYQEKYVFGIDFLLKYTTKFDYENNTISFYSDDRVIYHNSSKFFNEIAIILCISFLFAGIILTIVKYIKI